MKNRFFIVITAFTIIFLYLNFYNNHVIYFKVDPLYEIDISTLPQEEKNALSFIESSLSSNGGIYTNYTRSTISNGLPSGKDVLSESQGLALAYFLNINDTNRFKQSLNYSIRHLQMENKLFSWVRYEDTDKSTSNALIDDFRILRALIGAHEKWYDANYLKYAKQLSTSIIKYNINEGLPVDHYSMDEMKASPIISLSYLDTAAIKSAFSIDTRWISIYEASQQILEGGLDSENPFTALSYNTVSHEYQFPDEVCMVQFIYTLINMSEAEIDITSSLNWLSNELANTGRLYSKYNRYLYTPINDIESTAVYSLTAQLFFLEGKKQEAFSCLEAAKKYQIQDKNSQLYGAFGNEITKEAYSFDNLLYIYTSSILNQSNIR